MPIINKTGGVTAGHRIKWPGTSAPVGYLKENGAAISRTTYAALFAVIGTTFGAGDGVTTFNLPDTRARFERNLDDGKGVDAARALGTMQAGQMPSHSHTTVFNDITGAGNWVSYTGGSQTAPAVVTVPTSSVGGVTNGSENRPDNYAFLACIKY